MTSVLLFSSLLFIHYLFISDIEKEEEVIENQSESKPQEIVQIKKNGKWVDVKR